MEAKCRSKKNDIKPHRRQERGTNERTCRGATPFISLMNFVSFQRVRDWKTNFFSFVHTYRRKQAERRAVKKEEKIFVYTQVKHQTYTNTFAQTARHTWTDDQQQWSIKYPNRHCVCLRFFALFTRAYCKMNNARCEKKPHRHRHSQRHWKEKSTYRQNNNGQLFIGEVIACRYIAQMP